MREALSCHSAGSVWISFIIRLPRMSRNALKRNLKSQTEEVTSFDTACRLCCGRKKDELQIKQTGLLRSKVVIISIFITWRWKNLVIYSALWSFLASFSMLHVFFSFIFLMFTDRFQTAGCRIGVCRRCLLSQWRQFSFISSICDSNFIIRQ